MNYIIYHSILVFFLYFSPITLPVLSQLTVLILIFANNNLRSWLPKIHKLNILCTVHWSRPYLLAVSLPSPILACLRARPKPPCYAGYCWPSHHFLRKKKNGLGLGLGRSGLPLKPSYHPGYRRLFSRVRWAFLVSAELRRSPRVDRTGKRPGSLLHPLRVTSSQLNATSFLPS